MAEPKLERKLLEISHEIDSLQLLHQSKNEELREYVRLRDLLFENGPRLEEAIRIALRELGYEVSALNDGESEFDIIFVADGHRYIGEAEGKNNRAISIDKFSQLERNVQEDFAKESTTEYAIGVLFGNAFRLANPTDRKEWFTDKVLSAAKRTGIRLIRTADLFTAVQRLRMTCDVAFSAACRQAIHTQVGGVVHFPEIASREDLTVTTEAQ